MKQHNSEYFLTADLGGTNARLACVHKQTLAIEHLFTFKCADFESFTDVIQQWLESSQQALPTQACFAIAGPVANNHVKMTNLGWTIDADALKKSFGFSQLHLINDFAALANAAPVLSGDEIFCLKNGTAISSAPLAIIGPGTGFGVAALVPNGRQWITLASEGGHAGFAPTTELERELLNILSKTHTYTSIETLLCGRGLVEIYQALSKLQDLPATAIQNYSPSDITEQGLHDRDNLCVQTLEVFCGILGSVAADKALTYGARGGVYIAGGIVPRLRGFIEKTHFKAHFINKGVMSHYVENIPVQLMTAAQPALKGAGAWLRNSLS